MFGLGPAEMIVCGIVAVILFGSRLPSVARSMGKSLVEFKKGMRDIEEDVTGATRSESIGQVDYDDHADHEEPSAPRFEPPQSPPHSETVETTSQ